MIFIYSLLVVILWNYYSFVIFMHIQQIIKEQKMMEHTPPRVKNKPLSFSSKEDMFMNHFDELKDSKVSTQKSSRATQSDFQHLFQSYCKKQSEIDQIQSIFDNGQLFSLFDKPSPFTQSQAFLAFPTQIKNSVQEVNRFFEHHQPLHQNIQNLQILTSDRFAQFLASSISPSIELHEQKLNKQIERKTSQDIRYSSPKLTKGIPQRLIESKVDLLFTEISKQKQRKSLSMCYEQAMVIKLTQFVDYVTEDDQRYLGLDLAGKVHQILQNINEYKGKTIDGYLKIPLLENFLIQFKNLQEEKILKSKKQEKRNKIEQKISVCSELKMKSEKSSTKGKKYSEPNTKRKRKDLKQQDWIGNLN